MKNFPMDFSKLLKKIFQDLTEKNEPIKDQTGNKSTRIKCVIAVRVHKVKASPDYGIGTRNKYFP